MGPMCPAQVATWWPPSGSSSGSVTFSSEGNYGIFSGIFWASLFLHKIPPWGSSAENTIRISFIQITQVREQNQAKVLEK